MTLGSSELASRGRRPGSLGRLGGSSRVSRSLPRSLFECSVGLTVLGPLPCWAFRRLPASPLMTAPAYPGLVAFSWSPWLVCDFVCLSVCLTDSDFHVIRKNVTWAI